MTPLSGGAPSAWRWRMTALSSSARMETARCGASLIVAALSSRAPMSALKTLLFFAPRTRIGFGFPASAACSTKLEYLILNHHNAFGGGNEDYVVSPVYGPAEPGQIDKITTSEVQADIAVGDGVANLLVDSTRV